MMNGERRVRDNEFSSAFSQDTVNHGFFSKALDTLPKALEEDLLAFGYLIAKALEEDLLAFGYLIAKALEEGLL